VAFPLELEAGLHGLATRAAVTLPTRAAATRKTRAVALVEAIEGGAAGRAGGQRCCGRTRRRCGAEEALGREQQGAWGRRTRFARSDGTEMEEQGKNKLQGSQI